MLRLRGLTAPLIAACRAAMCVCVLFSGSIRAEQPASISVKVKPGLCLRFAKTQRCELQVQIDWLSAQAGEYCVFSEVSGSEAIRCWSNAQNGRAHIDISIQDDVRFWLSDSTGKKNLAETHLKIANVVNNEKRARHSRRHIWNLI